MADTLRIHLWPHSALRTVCAPVTAAEFGADLTATAQEMLRIIKRPATRGIGLAANQVGIMKRFFVMTTAAGEELVCVNPTWKNTNNEMHYAVEGCLSAPGVTERVLRYESVSLMFQTAEGVHYNVSFSGMDARVVQHECQHLDGAMYFENLPRQQRRHIAQQWAKARPVAIAQGLGI